MTKTLLQRQRELSNHAKGHGAIRFLGFNEVEYQGNILQVRKGVAKITYMLATAVPTDWAQSGVATGYIERPQWDRITIA